MVSQFKLKPIVLAVSSMLLVSGIANAAEDEKKQKKNEEEATEVIEVTGFKGSILKSMFQKRTSGNVSDSIFAEDIGKSTDQNIADALSRVTGVSVQSEDGEGTKVTVRGANPNQNIITLNGVQLTSSDFNQGVDLSGFSSDILSRIDVVKTPSADHDEGSLGASINLSTAKPLNLQKDIRSLTLQGRYSDFSENTDYKLSGSYSQKFLDDTFGVVVTAYQETTSIRRDQFSVNKFEPVEVDIARDLEGNIISNTMAITRSDIAYSLFQNERNRHGGTVTLQFLPTDTTDVVIDATYSKQETRQSENGIRVRTRPDLKNYEKGVENTIKADSGTDNFPTFSDPQQDWWTMDVEDRTLVKMKSRFGDGGYFQRENGDDTTNLVGNIKITQQLGDDVRVDFGVNYSRTELEPLGSASFNASNGDVPNSAKARATQEGDPWTGIEPAGFDCSSGPCEFVYGTATMYEGDPLDIYDNYSPAAFNPNDISSQRMQWMSFGERTITDTQKTAFVDLDWDVDLGFITKIEMGAKFSNRIKDTDDQTTQFHQTKVPVEIFDYDDEGNVTGSRGLISDGGNIGDIPIENFSSGKSFPVDDFMQSLGYPMNDVTRGWQTISAEKAFQLALGVDGIETEVDKTQSRKIELESSAAYLKLNFELTNALTGDVGVRYVKTVMNSEGYSGVNYFSGDLLNRLFDPFTMRQIRDPANVNGTCEYLNPLGDRVNVNGENVIIDASVRAFARLDGDGWDTRGTSDISDDVRLQPAAAYPCYDPQATKDAKANGAPFVYGDWANNRHSDISVSPNYPELVTDPETGETSVVIIDKTKQSFQTFGDNTYDMYLPSLNLNWAINDEFIARFATSKTMSRPNIDSLKPGFIVRESVWGTRTGNRIILSNPKLLPAESVNLDLSLEWYFNKTGLLSVALFHKDMTNFEEAEDTQTYMADLRKIDVSQGYDAGNLLKFEDGLREEFATNPTGVGACMPKRAIVNQLKEDWFFSDDLLDYCAEFTTSKIRNGSGASITGIEIGYSQTYDFLPGFWSGLGSSANYTYQESESDAEPSSIDPSIILPQFPQEWTPQHSYNATVFWQGKGHQLRLAYRGNTDQLARRYWENGSLWQEGKGTLDLSASYKLSKNVSVGFQAINITDTKTRTYFTSQRIDLGDTAMNADGEMVSVPYNEGSVFDGDVTKSRTQNENKTGRQYRVDLRVNF